MNKKLLIDLDGTILSGCNPINHSPLFFSKIQNYQIDFLIMTNSVKSPEQIQKRLSDSDINIPVSKIINPITAINSYLKRTNFKTAYIVGSKLESDQIHVIHDEVNPEIVVLLDFERDNYSYSDLQCIFVHLQNGIPAITASGSPFYLKEGQKYLDTGSFVKLFESALKTNIEVFGKPSKSYYREAMEILGCNSKEILVIGDDWRTDAQGALQSNCSALLIKSGKYQLGDERNITGLDTIDSLMEVFDYDN